MKSIVLLTFQLCWSLFKTRKSLVLENLMLRQQLNIYKRKNKRPKLENIDRIILVWISRVFSKWKSVLVVAKASTLIGWHRKGFKLYWKRKSRRVGGPNIDWPLIKLIRRMQKENPLWSAQRIQGELAILGYSVCDNTVAKYMQKPKTDPGKIQRWLTFLRNHAKYTVGIDFLVVRTLTFRAIYVFVAISHDRRKILHFAVSSSPHSQWAIQQLRETFAFDENTKYVIRDNDGIYSKEFKQTIIQFGLKDTPTAPRSPWQNPFCKRVIGTLRRECLDHMIILNEKHLYNILHEYIFEYYNVCRTHMSLGKDSPEHRPVQKYGKIKAKPILGGLHHIYSRAA